MSCSAFLTKTKKYWAFVIKFELLFYSSFFVILIMSFYYLKFSCNGASKWQKYVEFAMNGFWILY